MKDLDVYPKYPFEFKFRMHITNQFQKYFDSRDIAIKAVQ